MIYKVIRTIGKSDNTGTRAILIPSRVPYFNVSKIINVNKGPGVNPPLKPKIIPATSNEYSDSDKIKSLLL
jgi:hypothetical protein